VVRSVQWNGYRGAVTSGNDSTAIHGVVSEANSLVGSNAADQVGLGPVTLFDDGSYLLVTPFWNANRGAATPINAAGRTLDARGMISPQNSLLGRDPNAGLRNVVTDPLRQVFLAPFLTEATGRLSIGLAEPNQFTYARAQAQTVTLTPDFLTATLNTGTGVVLQASNDITVDDPIAVPGTSRRESIAGRPRPAFRGPG